MGDEKGANQMELSRHSMVGLDMPRMMKLKGVLEGKEVVVLIDSGASHSFIPQKLVQELKIPI